MAREASTRTPSRTMHFFQLLLIFFGFCTQPAFLDCPVLCECKWKSGKESVICLNANLANIPQHLDAGTQVLDLTGNNVAFLKHDEFSNAGLVNLQKIYISKCRLKSLERYAFRNLINLVELDLSYNALSSIPSHTFDSIPELRELKLNGNPIQRISNEAFVNLPQLIRLEITECRVTTIESRGFVGLEQSLEWLKLDKNRLSEVKSSSFTMLKSLHGLELAGNPWNCSCGLRPLREWMLRQNVPFGIPPICQFPKRLQLKPWDKLELDDFACVPEIFAYDSKAHGIEGKNVTMTCRIAGTPEPNVRWMLKNKVIANLSSSTYPSGKKLYVVHMQNNSSDLTIFSADLQDAGTYVCSAENKAGRAEASVTLAVSKKPPDAGFSNKVLVVSVLSGIGIVSMSCLIGIFVCSVRKRQILKWRSNRECRREDNYEKIEMNHKVSGNANGGVIQNEIAVVGGGSGGRKNGEYRVVPDTDHEGEDEEESNIDAVVAKTQKSMGKMQGTSGEKPWNSPEHLLDPEDLHIPRRTLQEARDNIKKTCSSTCGTYNQYAATSSRLPTTYISTTNRILSGLSEEPKIPDLIDNYSSGSKNKNIIGKAHSENGSVSDINELFCTLPRKKAAAHSLRYKSNDSQSPLLPESRYGSSGGESSNGSQENGLRRMSDTQPKYPQSNLNRNRVNKISNSYLNLTRDEPTTQLLLDVSSLENRVQFKRELISPSATSTPNANSYDYHAAQLERFLEEYRTLQKQLTKMKETCDNLCQDKTNTAYRQTVSPSTSDENSASSKNNFNNQISPNSNRSLEDTVEFRNFESELTKYLMSKTSASSPKNLNTGVFHN